jgi:CRP/FNR family transcriptional regulator
MPFATRDPNLLPCHGAHSCSVCPVGRDCLMDGARVGDGPGAAHDADFVRRPLAPHAALFDAGSEARAVYVVRAGCIKTFSVDHDGDEHVRGFYFPGDIVGLEGVVDHQHRTHAVAVVASQVCCVPKTQLMPMLKLDNELMLRLLTRISGELAQAQALCGDYSADQRVAAFLLHLHERTGSDAETPIPLPMTRRDIAKHLRLATETVSRVLTRFGDRGMIQSSTRSIRLLRPQAMAYIARPVGLSEASVRCAA